MADMRLIVAGAGGRMGRALVRVISETPGAVLAGALEAPGSELLGKDAGVLVGDGVVLPMTVAVALGVRVAVARSVVPSMAKTWLPLRFRMSDSFCSLVRRS